MIYSNIDLDNLEFKRIFIEAPDAHGKSTIANYLSNELTLTRINEHTAKFVNSDYGGDVGSMCYGQYHTFLQLVKSFNLKNFVADRSYISELIYSMILKRKSNINYKWIYDIEHLFQQEHFIHIFLFPEIQEIKKIYKKRGDDYIKKLDVLLRLRQAYEDYAFDSNIKKIIIKNQSLEKTKKTLKDIFKNEI